VIRTKPPTKAMTDGPLESMFPIANSKILDFLSTYKSWDYSVSDIARYSGVSFKTALTEIKKLKEQGVVVKTRTVGNATMYQFNMESKQAYYIDRLINEIATRRIMENISSSKQIKVKTRKPKGPQTADKSPLEGSLNKDQLIKAQN